jgi:hypothetical protein
MKEKSTKGDVEKTPAGKTDRLEVAPGVEPSADVVTKPAGKKDRLELAPGVEASEDIIPLHNAAAAAAAAAADMESTLVTAKDRKEAREMRRKKRQNTDVVTKPAGKKDRLELAPGVEASEGITPLHNAAAAAVAINQASASRGSLRSPYEQNEDDSCSVASSTSSGRPGAVRVGGTKSNHDEWALQTQEVGDAEQGSEAILPIAAEVVVPNDDSENNITIAEAQIVETAKARGPPRWLIFALLGVFVVVAIRGRFGHRLWQWWLRQPWRNSPPSRTPGQNSRRNSIGSVWPVSDKSS